MEKECEVVVASAVSVSVAFAEVRDCASENREDGATVSECGDVISQPPPPDDGRRQLGTTICAADELLLANAAGDGGACVPRDGDFEETTEAGWANCFAFGGYRENAFCRNLYAGSHFFGCVPANEPERCANEVFPEVLNCNLQNKKSQWHDGACSSQPCGDGQQAVGIHCRTAGHIVCADGTEFNGDRANPGCVPLRNFHLLAIAGSESAFNALKGVLDSDPAAFAASVTTTWLGGNTPLQNALVAAVDSGNNLTNKPFLPAIVSLFAANGAALDIYSGTTRGASGCDSGRQWNFYQYVATEGLIDAVPGGAFNADTAHSPLRLSVLAELGKTALDPTRPDCGRTGGPNLLHRASRWGLVELAEIVFAADNADADRKGSDGLPPVVEVANGFAIGNYGGAAAVLAMLTLYAEAGADFNATGADGKAVLDVLVEARDDPDVVAGGGADAVVDYLRNNGAECQFQFHPLCGDAPPDFHASAAAGSAGALMTLAIVLAANPADFRLSLAVTNAFGDTPLQTALTVAVDSESNLQNKPALPGMVSLFLANGAAWDIYTGTTNGESSCDSNRQWNLYQYVATHGLIDSVPGGGFGKDTVHSPLRLSVLAELGKTALDATRLDCGRGGHSNLLHRATYSGLTELAEIVFAADNVDPDRKRSDGLPPLLDVLFGFRDARYDGAPEVLAMLTLYANAGADFNAARSDGRTALDVLAESAADEDVADGAEAVGDYLKANGATCQVADHPLCAHPGVVVVEFSHSGDGELSAASGGAVVNSGDDIPTGATVTLTAAPSGGNIVARWTGACKNGVGETGGSGGKTCAARRFEPGNLSVGAVFSPDETNAALVAEVAKSAPALAEVRRLLNQNASPDAEDDGGVPVILIAAASLHAEVVSVLVTAGANVVRGHPTEAGAVPHMMVVNPLDGTCDNGDETRLVRDVPGSARVLKYFNDALAAADREDDYKWGASYDYGGNNNLPVEAFLPWRFHNCVGNAAAADREAYINMSRIVLSRGRVCNPGNFHESRILCDPDRVVDFPAPAELVGGALSAVRVAADGTQTAIDPGATIDSRFSIRFSAAPDGDRTVVWTGHCDETPRDETTCDIPRDAHDLQVSVVFAAADNFHLLAEAGTESAFNSLRSVLQNSPAVFAASVSAAFHNGNTPLQSALVAAVDPASDLANKPFLPAVVSLFVANGAEVSLFTGTTNGQSSCDSSRQWNLYQYVATDGLIDSAPGGAFSADTVHSPLRLSVLAELGKSALDPTRNDCARSGANLMHRASYWGLVEFAEVVLSADNADPDRKRPDGLPPIVDLAFGYRDARYDGASDVLAMLTLYANAGADFNTARADGKAVLDVLVDVRNDPDVVDEEQVADYLKANGAACQVVNHSLCVHPGVVTVEFSQSEGGILSAASDGAVVNSGDTIPAGATVTITAAPAADHLLARWTADCETVGDIGGGGNKTCALYRHLPGNISVGAEFAPAAPNQSLLAEARKANSDPAEVARLLQQGAVPHLRDDDGVPVLLIAAVSLNAPAVSVLVTAGADISVVHPTEGQSPLPKLMAVNQCPGSGSDRTPARGWPESLNVLRHFQNALSVAGKIYDYGAADSSNLRPLDYLVWRYNNCTPDDIPDGDAILQMRDILRIGPDGEPLQCATNNIICVAERTVRFPAPSELVGGALSAVRIAADGTETTMDPGGVTLDSRYSVRFSAAPQGGRHIVWTGNCDPTPRGETTCDIPRGHANLQVSVVFENADNFHLLAEAGTENAFNAIRSVLQNNPAAFAASVTTTYLGGNTPLQNALVAAVRPASDLANKPFLPAVVSLFVANGAEVSLFTGTTNGESSCDSNRQWNLYQYVATEGLLDSVPGGGFNKDTVHSPLRLSVLAALGKSGLDPTRKDCGRGGEPNLLHRASYWGLVEFAEVVLSADNADPDRKRPDGLPPIVDLAFGYRDARYDGASDVLAMLTLYANAGADFNTARADGKAVLDVLVDVRDDPDVVDEEQVADYLKANGAICQVAEHPLCVHPGVVTVLYSSSDAGTFSAASGGLVVNSGGGFPTGATVTITPAPSADHRFERWTGDCDGAGETCELSRYLPETVSIGGLFVPLATDASLVAEAAKTAPETPDLAVVRRLLGEHANPDATNDNGVPVILLAATNLHPEMVSVLVTAEANVSATHASLENWPVPHLMAVNQCNGANPNRTPVRDWTESLNVLRHFNNALSTSEREYNYHRVVGGRAAVGFLSWRYFNCTPDDDADGDAILQMRNILIRDQAGGAVHCGDNNITCKPSRTVNFPAASELSGGALSAVGLDSAGNEHPLEPNAPVDTRLSVRFTAAPSDSETVQIAVWSGDCAAVPRGRATCDIPRGTANVNIGVAFENTDDFHIIAAVGTEAARMSLAARLADAPLFFRASLAVANADGNTPLQSALVAAVDATANLQNKPALPAIVSLFIANGAAWDIYSGTTRGPSGCNNNRQWNLFQYVAKRGIHRRSNTELRTEPSDLRLSVLAELGKTDIETTRADCGAGSVGGLLGMHARAARYAMGGLLTVMANSRNRNFNANRGHISLPREVVTGRQFSGWGPTEVVDIMRLLLDNGVSPNQRDNQNRSGLDRLVEVAGDYDIRTGSGAAVAALMIERGGRCFTRTSAEYCPQNTVVRFAQPENGSLSAASDGNPVTVGAMLDAGAAITFTADPDDDHFVARWTGNCDGVGDIRTAHSDAANKTCVFANAPAGLLSVGAVFAPANVNQLLSDETAKVRPEPAEVLRLLNLDADPDNLVNGRTPALEAVFGTWRGVHADFPRAQIVSILITAGATPNPGGRDFMIQAGRNSDNNQQAILAVVRHFIAALGETAPSGDNYDWGANTANLNRVQQPALGWLQAYCDLAAAPDACREIAALMYERGSRCDGNAGDELCQVPKETFSRQLPVGFAAPITAVVARDFGRAEFDLSLPDAAKVSQLAAAGWSVVPLTTVRPHQILVSRTAPLPAAAEPAVFTITASNGATPVREYRLSLAPPPSPQPQPAPPPDSPKSGLTESGMTDPKITDLESGSLVLMTVIAEFWRDAVATKYPRPPAPAGFARQRDN